MTKAEYDKAQVALSRYEQRAMLEAERELKAAIAAAAKSALETGKIDHEKLVGDMNAVYEKYRYMAADKATDVAERHLPDCYEEAGLTPVRNSQMAALKKNAGEWGKRTEAEGLMWGWFKTPDGETVFVPEARRVEFLRKYHLSDSASPMRVWDILSEAAAETEERIFAVLEGGRAMGRDVKDIGKDLETFINYKDGGERVIGRWMSMVSPYKADGTRDEKKIRQGWERAYIEKLNEGKDPLAGDWIEYPPNGVPPLRDPFNDPYAEVRRILDAPHAQDWIKRESTGKRGRTLLPPGARAYTNRLGKAGLDYRAIRLMRTESAVNFNERQDRLAETNPASTGKVMRKLDERRDAWKCLCQEAAKECRRVGGWRPSEILPKYKAPLHTNCVAKGSLVKTLRGEIPIEKITVADFVMGDSGKFRRVLKVHNSIYTGKIFTIKPRGMRGVGLTHNHPVFVYGRGWVEAQSLKNGDKLLASYSVPLRPNTENLPSFFGQIVKFFLVLSYPLRRIAPTAAIDLNGYHLFRNSKVNIVNPNRIKGDGSNTITGNKLKKNNFINRHFSFFIDAARSLFKSVDRLTCASQGFIIVSVKSIRCEEKKKVPVYNLSVDVDNDFFANDILIHNCNCQDRPIMKDPKEFLSEILKKYELE